MSKYRFKTEEEFKRDGLWKGDHPDSWTSSGSMNGYLGQDIPDEYNGFCDVNKDFSYDGWSFSPDDYVLKEIQPEYTVGKWYGCKNWCSSKDFVKLERVYDSQAYFTECLNAGNYQKEGQNWWSFTTADPLFEADMSIVSPLLPDGHPDKIVSEKSFFVLPSKWCIKVDRDCQPEEVYKWRDLTWVDSGYINYTAEWTGGIKHNHTEITLEQFKQHVLKESPVVETTKEIDMKDIQEEAKKRFPIGCKFIPVDGVTTYTLIEDDCTYKINNKSIWAHNMHGYLYLEGKWATLVSSPETKKEMFYEGDYIVTLDVEGGDWNCARKNYCFKQRITNKGIYPTVDLQGSIDNGHNVMSFDKKQWLKDWRYATPEEEAEYERVGKPYNVTTLQKKEEYIPEYVECVRSGTEDFIFGKIYNWPEPVDNKGRKRDIDILDGSLWGFKPSTKEAYEAQKTSKTTIIEEWTINTPSIKKETFIENVQSVDIEIYRKKKIRIF